MPKKGIYAAIAIGLISGLILFFSPGSVFFIALTIITVFIINRILHKKERDFILKLFLWGFGLRVFCVLLTMACLIHGGHILNYGTSISYIGRDYPDVSTPYIFDDEGYYTLRGQITNMYWSDKPLSDITITGIVQNQYGFTSFVYVLASYFALFGYSPISSRFINCFLGIITALIIYSMVKDIFGERPARLSSISVAFFPSLFLWSITNLKETIFIFAVCLMLWTVVKFVKTRNIYYLAAILASTLFQFIIRRGYRELVMLTVVVLLVYFILLFLSHLYKKRKVGLLVLIFLTAGCFIFIKSDKINSALDDITERALVMHRGASFDEHAINYKLLSAEEMDRALISRGKFLAMLAKGWLHLMLEPLPSNIKSSAMLVSYFQMILWYLLIPFFILGIFLSIRYKFKESFILLLYFLIMGSALAVSGGNVGTTFRLRDTITPLFLVFSCVGIVNILTKHYLQQAQESQI